MSDEAAGGIGYSGALSYIEASHAANHAAHQRLVEKIKKFEPLPRQAYFEAEQAELARLRQLNPTKIDGQLEGWVKTNFDFAARPDVQLFEKFGDEYAALTISSCIICAALCEALINANLSISFHLSGKSDIIPAIDSASLLDKWVIAPKISNQNYNLNKSGIVYLTLKNLISARNNFCHHKIELRDHDGNKIHQGSRLSDIGLGEASYRQKERFFRLPYALQANYLRQVPTSQRFFFEHLLELEDCTRLDPVPFLKA